MRKIIFSKQADHDGDLAPFWCHWYQNIFKADVIIITPVKLPNSSTEAIEAFYRAKNITTIPIELDSWDARVIWKIQQDILEKCIGKNSSFVAISADTDQFFEPLTHLNIRGDLVVFERINILSEKTPSRRNISDLKVSTLVPENDNPLKSISSFVAGFINSFHHEDVIMTGHYRGSTQRISSQNVFPREYHLRLRGVDHFVDKIEALNFKTLSGTISLHLKKWVGILKNEGRIGLENEYKRLINTDRIRDDLHADDFKRIAATHPVISAIDWGFIENLLNTGKLLLRNGRLDEAAEMFSGVVRLVPNHCEALNNLGVIAHRRKNERMAESLFEKALASNRFYRESLYNMEYLQKELAGVKSSSVNAA